MLTAAKLEVRECCELTENCVVPGLLPNMVSVWTRSLRGCAELVQRCYELLSPEERERAARFRVEKPRQEFIVTRGTLRSLAGGYLNTSPEGISFRYSEHGKPTFQGASDLRFNVSHTDGLAVIAFVNKREIGVDVEKVSRIADARQLAERFFSIREREALHNLSGDELQAAFFRCWTRKEAYVKARGEGLSLPLHQFDVSVAAGEARALLATRPDASEAKRWNVRDLATSNGYAAAVAVAVAETANG